MVSVSQLEPVSLSASASLLAEASLLEPVSLSVFPLAVMWQV